MGCTNCSYTASHQNRNSSHGVHLVANITFSANIEFRSGSTVKVSGEYALSITSQNGHIRIQTDINMTCGEKVPNTTCLGGFTQSSIPKIVRASEPKIYQGDLWFLDTFYVLGFHLFWHVETCHTILAFFHFWVHVQTKLLISRKSNHRITHPYQK